MRVNWVLANTASFDPTVDIDPLKDIGSFWGSWQTWRSCSTDNVICSNFKKSSELIQREFQKVCNLYIPNDDYVALDRPVGVRLFGGKYENDILKADEIISMHLASSQSDIVLLLGFDWTEQATHPDRLLEHRAYVYRHLVKHAIKENPQVQWVLIDHPGNIMSDLAKLENLTKDTLKNVLDMLG